MKGRDAGAPVRILSQLPAGGGRPGGGLLGSSRGGPPEARGPGARNGGTTAHHLAPNRATSGAQTGRHRARGAVSASRPGRHGAGAPRRRR
jgi:hypothetical protein